MLKVVTFVFLGVPLLSGCLTMDPIVFTSDHPANAQAVDRSERATVSVVSEYTPRRPHHPLDDTESAPATAGTMNHDNMKNRPGMDHGITEAAPASTGSASPVASEMYTCPMHPKIMQDHEGRCPICEMRLVPVKEEAASDSKGEKQ